MIEILILLGIAIAGGTYAERLKKKGADARSGGQFRGKWVRDTTGATFLGQTYFASFADDGDVTQAALVQAFGLDSNVKIWAPSDPLPAGAFPESQGTMQSGYRWFAQFRAEHQEQFPPVHDLRLYVWTAAS